VDFAAALPDRTFGSQRFLASRSYLIASKRVYISAAAAI
jgi:hypothetical protein